MTWSGESVKGQLLLAGNALNGFPAGVIHSWMLRESWIRGETTVFFRWPGMLLSHHSSFVNEEVKASWQFTFFLGTTSAVVMMSSRYLGLSFAWVITLTHTQLYSFMQTGWKEIKCWIKNVKFKLKDVCWLKRSNEKQQGLFDAASHRTHLDSPLLTTLTSLLVTLS